MPDYKEMYLKLFRSQTNALRSLQLAQETLEAAQKETEELFLSTEAPNLHIIHPDPQEKEDTQV